MINLFSGVNPTITFPIYSTTKYGVVGFTRSLKDCSKSDGVRINALCPGLVDTKLIRDWLEEHPEKERMKPLFFSKMIRYNIVC